MITKKNKPEKVLISVRVLNAKNKLIAKLKDDLENAVADVAVIAGGNALFVTVNLGLQGAVNDLRDQRDVLFAKIEEYEKQTILLN